MHGQLLAQHVALCSQKAIHLLPGERGEILGRIEVGREKVPCWRTKEAISLKRVKMEEKLLWTAYGNSPTLFRTVPSEQKPIKFGKKSSRGRCQGVPKIFRAPIHRVQCAVIFATAQLSRCHRCCCCVWYDRTTIVIDLRHACGMQSDAVRLLAETTGRCRRMRTQIMVAMDTHVHTGHHRTC